MAIEGMKKRWVKDWFVWVICYGVSSLMDWVEWRRDEWKTHAARAIRRRCAPAACPCCVRFLVRWKIEILGFKCESIDCCQAIDRMMGTEIYCRMASIVGLLFEAVGRTRWVRDDSDGRKRKQVTVGRLWRLLKSWASRKRPWVKTKKEFDRKLWSIGIGSAKMWSIYLTTARSS